MIRSYVFNIPLHCYVRWQAALAVLEDLLEDTAVPFSMRSWGDSLTQWEKKNGCGTVACYAGYIAVAPYCIALGYTEGDGGQKVETWLLDSSHHFDKSYNTTIHGQLFDGGLDKSTRARTLEFLMERVKRIFFDSTGVALVAPEVFYIEDAEPVVPNTVDSKSAAA